MKLLLLHSKKIYLIILIFVLANHGLLILNDGVYWDGWLIYTYLSEKKYDLLQQMFMEGGSPFGFLFHRIMGYFPNIIFGYKLVAFFSLVAISILIYHIFIELTVFSKLEALLVTLIATSYPAFQVHFELIIVPSGFLYACFFGGIITAIKFFKLEKNTNNVKFFLRLLSLVLLFVSFTLQSLLCFYFVFLGIIIFVKEIELYKNKKNINIFFLLKKSIEFVKYYPDFLLIPFVFCFFRNVFFPVNGLYSSYNTIIFSWSTFQKVIKIFLQQSVSIQLFNSLKEILERPLTYLVLASMFFFFCKTSFYVKRNVLYRPTNLTKFYIKFAFGIALFAMAIFPYAAVGKYPSSTGWNTRMAFLIALPIGVIIVSFLSLININKLTSRVTLTFLSIVLISFTSLNVQNYITWQARWIVDRSIIINLAQVQDAEQVSVFWIDYRLPLVSENRYFYTFYEWSSIFKQVWGDESRIGFHKEFKKNKLFSEHRRAFTERYNLSDFNPSGKQACLIIDSGPKKNNYNQLFIRYHFNKVLGQKHLSEFLKDITSLELAPSNKCT